MAIDSLQVMLRAVLTAPAQLGVASILLHAASVRWAHHWSNPRTDAVVAAWAAAALATLVLGIRVRAKLPLAFAAISVLALAVSGAAWAIGFDAAGPCSGG